MIGAVLALLAAQPIASEGRARRALGPGASPSWRAGSRPTAPATITPPRRRCAPRSGRICAARTGRFRARRRASSTTATTTLRATASRRWRTGTAAPAQMAPFRIADCLWMEGDRAKAAASYARLVKTATARTGDVALARFRVAEAAPGAIRPPASKQFLAIARDFPAHPLGDEALRRWRGAPARRRGAAPPTPQTTPPTAPPAADLAPADRLKRAESLTKDRHWDQALAELARLPATLPPELAAERDYQIGMTKFHMRRDYAKAGELLLGAVDAPVGRQGGVGAVPRRARAVARGSRRRGDRRLPQGDRGVPALALRAPRRSTCRAGSSTTAAASRRASRRCRRRSNNFGSSAFADDAAWSLAFAHFLLGDAAEAAAGLRSLRAPAADRHRLRRDRRAREVLARAPQGEGRTEGRRPRRATASSPSGAALVLRAAGAGAPQAGRPRGAARAAGQEGRRRRRRASRCASRRSRARPS